MSEMIEVSNDNENFIIKVGDRIDTNNVTQIQEEIFNTIEGLDNNTHLIIDCYDLDYISSAGLRMVMLIMRKHPNMELVDVGPAPYEVFEVTAFSDVIPITKKKEKLT